MTKADMTEFHFEEFKLLMAGRWWNEDDVLFFLGIIKGYPYERWMLYFRNLFESIIDQYEALKPLLVELVECGIVEWNRRVAISGIHDSYRHKQELVPSGGKKRHRKKRRRDHDGSDHGSVGSSATVPDEEHHGAGCVEGHGTTLATP